MKFRTVLMYFQVLFHFISHLFSNVTPHLKCFKNFQIGKKTSETPVCLGGADQFFQISKKNKGARRQSCQQLKRKTPNIDGKGHEREKKSAKFHHSY